MAPYWIGVDVTDACCGFCGRRMLVLVGPLFDKASDVRVEASFVIVLFEFDADV